MIDRGRVAWKGKQERTDARTDGRAKRRISKSEKGEGRETRLNYSCGVLGQVISIGSLLCWPRQRTTIILVIGHRLSRVVGS